MKQVYLDFQVPRKVQKLLRRNNYWVEIVEEKLKRHLFKNQIALVDLILIALLLLNKAFVRKQRVYVDGKVKQLGWDGELHRPLVLSNVVSVEFEEANQLFGAPFQGLGFFCLDNLLKSLHGHSIGGAVAVHSLVEELQIAHQSNSLVNDSEYSCSKNVCVKENKLEEGMLLSLCVISQLHNRNYGLVRGEA